MDRSLQSGQAPPTEPEPAALRALIEKLKIEALADAERIAVLRAQVESAATDVPALLSAHHQLCRHRFGPPSLRSAARGHARASTGCVYDGRRCECGVRLHGRHLSRELAAGLYRQRN
jgi:hypothetical protein